VIVPTLRCCTQIHFTTAAIKQSIFEHQPKDTDMISQGNDPSEEMFYFKGELLQGYHRNYC
jgi:hypothetical protein